MDDEGCLSLQGLLVPVERPSSVTVKAKDPQGADVTLELTGFEARACQHEFDHLDGVLMIDRTTDEARREAMAVLRQRSALGVRRSACPAIGFAATAPFGADVLERLAARHEISFCLTRPDRPAGRGRRLDPAAGEGRRREARHPGAPARATRRDRGASC